MAIATYFFKIARRLLFLVVIILLTLALFSFREEYEEDDFTFEITEKYIKYNDKGKFILLWTDPKASPFNYFGKGSHVFRQKSCRFTNCYVTGDRNELGDVSLFDAILFNGPQLTSKDLPESRTPSQKYIYANIESAENYPVCNFNGYFNWTLTYRLDSDINFGYFVVKNTSGHVVAPSADVIWKSNDVLGDVRESLKGKLKSKKKAVAWFATNCHTKSRREEFVEKMKGYLNNFSLSVDVYGACGTMQCPAFVNDRCLHLLEEEYYFYFAFENSFSVDYVTEKIMNAYRHNAVPVVYGGANYSRFLPPDSYLNARELGPEKLAHTIDHLIKNPAEYHKYFRWQNQYSFHYRHDSSDTDDYCRFCKMLNGDRMYEMSVHHDIEEWWNGNYSCTA